VKAARTKGKSSDGFLPKCPTGIRGFDEITGGGLPRGRPSLLAGHAGSGKTLLAMEFLVKGATAHNEPGVFVAFEERAEELTKNMASLGFNLKALEAKKKIALDHVRIERRDIEETGEYDLEALFIRLEHAIDSIGAKRIVLDTIESLFSGLKNEAILRAELRRLFQWLKDKGVTAVITAERGEDSLTRHGLEEYVADCVILLDHRVTEQVSTRRLRIVKYRGSRHGTNEYPFLIGDDGIFLVSLSAMGLEYAVSDERIPTGIGRLDAMFGGKGYYRGSSILVSGTPGTGKTTVAATFADAACRRGERCLYFAFEESKEQIFRNMGSIGMDLGRWEKKGLLHVHASRPTFLGIEEHLLSMNRLADDFKPSVVVIDPISNLTATGNFSDVTALLGRLIDYYKSRGITTLFTSLVARGEIEETSGMEISSLMDTWLLLQDIASGGERNRGLFILKSRGMAHSNQIREYRITDNGIALTDVSLSGGEVLMGSARSAQEAREKVEAERLRQEAERRKRLYEQKRHEREARMAALRAEDLAEKQDMEAFLAAERAREQESLEARGELARMRRADVIKKAGTRRTTGDGRGGSRSGGTR
jgi:circadian clock protein KaiC